MNAIQCLACGTVLISKSRHDFQQCECENAAFTDGDSDYQRSGALNLGLVRVLTKK